MLNYWFMYSNIDVNNQPSHFKTKERECLDCKELTISRDYEDTLEECDYCKSKNLGNETIKLNPNI